MEDTKEEVKVKVLGAGLARTGTKSLMVALEMLGFGPCQHMSTLSQDSDLSNAWLKVYESKGKKSDWATIFEGYQSSVDQPTADFVPELLSAYPDALWILTERDSSEEWWQSVQESVLPTSELAFRLAVYPIPGAREMSRVAKATFDKMRSSYGVPLGPLVHEKHNALVKEIVPEKNLLVYNVKQGWEPLCKFLGVPVPKAPFPKVNDRKEYQQMVMKVEGIGMSFYGGVIAIVGAVAVGIQQAIATKAWGYFA